MAQANESDAFEAIDEAVGWARLLRVRSEVEDLAKLANEDPLLRAADRWRTLRRFAPEIVLRAGSRWPCVLARCWLAFRVEGRGVPASPQRQRCNPESVAEVAVVGKPDPERTEIIKAFVVLRGNTEPTEALAEELRQLVRQRLSAHAYPREVSFETELIRLAIQAR